jgi:predicted metalloprotease with PDZ domain
VAWDLRRELHLVKTPGGWKIALGHTSMLPPDFGVEPDYQQDHGGMKFAEVAEGGPAGKAGFKSGDVLSLVGSDTDLPCSVGMTR